MVRGKPGSAIYLLGLIASILIGLLLMVTVTAAYSLRAPWAQIVGGACLFGPIYAFSKLSERMKPVERGWLVVDDYFRTSLPERRSIFWKSVRPALVLGPLIFLGWLYFSLRTESGQSAPRSVSDAVIRALIVAVKSGGGIAFFSWALYAGRVRKPAGKSADEPAKDSSSPPPIGLD